MPSTLTPVTDAASLSGRRFVAGGMSAPQGLILAIGPSAEFSWTYDLSRRCWVIRRRGTVYSVIVESRKYPAHTESYVRRVVAMLNEEVP